MRFSTNHPSLQPFATPLSIYIDTHKPAFKHLATSSFIFYPSPGSTPALPAQPERRTLLLQRASHDSHPHLWEPPGGAVDAEDASILEAAAREVREETGLIVGRVLQRVGAVEVFRTRRGLLVGRVYLVVEIEEAGDGQDGEAKVETGKPAVQVDPNEHQGFWWATRREVQEERGEDGVERRLVPGGMKETVLEAFEMVRQREVEGR